MPTREEEKANPAKTPPAIPKPAPLPPIKTLQQYLTAAYNAEKGTIEPTTMTIDGHPIFTKSFAISIIALDGGVGEYSGINDTDMLYSGSLVKVAALYAAHDLRALARVHAASQTFTKLKDFQDSFAIAVNPTGAMQQLRTMSVGLKPKLQDILVGWKPSGPDRVEFKSPSYTGHLNNVGANAGARGIIRPLGYSFINVSLMRANFFDPDPAKLNGIWLAGDYSGDLPADKRLDVSRVPVVNDNVPGGSAQATTTKEMSRMFRLMHTETGFTHITDAAERADANRGMHAILTGHGTFDPSPYPVPAKFSIHCDKVGIGVLGPIDSPGAKVFSEGLVVRWGTPAQVTSFNTAHSRSLTGDFVLVWQGGYSHGGSWNAIGRLAASAMENFLIQA